MAVRPSLHAAAHQNGVLEGCTAFFRHQRASKEREDTFA
jgi:hypothetical protein